MNKLTPFYQTAIVASALIFMSASFAEISKDLDHKSVEKELPTIEQHPPHEHGAATLTIAIDANHIEIDLESPADNIFGFEYVPSTEVDKQKVKDAVKQLKEEKTLFTISEAAQCHLDRIDISSAMFDDIHIDTTKNISKEHLTDNNKEDTKKSTKENNKKSTEHQHVHNDVDTSWFYSCQSGEQLESITPHFFSVFSSGFKQLKVEWLTPTGASSSMISKDKAIKFKILE